MTRCTGRASKCPDCFSSQRATSSFFRLNGDEDDGEDDDLESGSYPMSNGATLVLTIPTDGPGHVGEAKTLDFQILGGVAGEIRLKGGPNGHNVYDYLTQHAGELATGPVSSDDYLHSPPRDSESFGGLSHISVCSDVGTELQIVKTPDSGTITLGERQSSA